MRGPACITQRSGVAMPGTWLAAADLRRLAAAGSPSNAGRPASDWLRSRANRQAPDERAMTDTIQQRINMVDSQVRPSDVTDRRIIKAMLEVPREAFAPGDMHALAYMDAALPVTKASAERAARTLLPPRTLAKMLQLAAVEPECSVLDVGCATGYSTALIGKLAGKVVGLEADPDLAERARAALNKVEAAGIKVVQGPLAAGVADEAPFDAILLNGAVPEVPQTLLDQLKDGGRLVAIVAPTGYGRVQVWRRTGRSFGSITAFDAAADLLPGFAHEPGFVF